MNEIEFREKIIRVLENNGYPANPVSLPLESLYDSAHKHGINLNKVLDTLTEAGVVHEKTPEKIIFTEKEESADMDMGAFSGLAEKFQSLDPSIIETLTSNINPSGNMFDQMRDLASKLSPEQLSSLSSLYSNLSPEEKKAMQSMAEKQS